MTQHQNIFFKHVQWHSTSRWLWRYRRNFVIGTEHQVITIICYSSITSRPAIITRLFHRTLLSLQDLNIAFTGLIIVIWSVVFLLGLPVKFLSRKWTQRSPRTMSAVLMPADALWKEPRYPQCLHRLPPSRRPLQLRPPDVWQKCRHACHWQPIGTRKLG